MSAGRTARQADDARWEKKLRVNTAAAGYEKDDQNHSRYEPTAYRVLERLAKSGYIGPDDTLVDYGCGKGRVSFFLHYAVGCRTVGVEYNGELVRAARENLMRYAGRAHEEGEISFVCANAEEYEPDGATCFYFFNPFSQRLLQAVIGRILLAYYEHQWPVRLFFYYALDPYLTHLMTEDMLRPEGEIDCRDLFDGGDEREKILVFRIG